MLCVHMSGTTDPKIPLPSALEKLLNDSMNGEFLCVSESEMGSSEGSWHSLTQNDFASRPEKHELVGQRF